MADEKRSIEPISGPATSRRPKRPGTSAASFISIAAPGSPRAGARSSATWRKAPRPASPGCWTARPGRPVLPSPRSSSGSPPCWARPRSPPATSAGSRRGGSTGCSSPRPAGRAADADVAQPLRHQQPEGQRPRGHEATERDLPPPGPRTVRRDAGAAVRDPALLIWLDAPANRKGHPNENLARELMELFTLGIGHYTESDVKETARALTGWTVVDGAFREAPRGMTGGQDDPRQDGKLAGRRRGSDPPGTPGDGRPAGLAALRPVHG